MSAMDWLIVATHPRFGADVQAVDGDMAAVADHLGDLLVLPLKPSKNKQTVYDRHLYGIRYVLYILYLRTHIRGIKYDTSIHAATHSACIHRNFRVFSFTSCIQDARVTFRYSAAAATLCMWTRQPGFTTHKTREGARSITTCSTGTSYSCSTRSVRGTHSYEWRQHKTRVGLR